MSFVSFLKQVGKMGIGYGLGFLLLAFGLFAYSMQDNPLGILLAIIGFVLLLFGVYTERQFRGQP